MAITSIAASIGEAILEDLATEALSNTNFKSAFLNWLEGLGAKLKINPTAADEIGNALIGGAKSIVGAIVAGTPAVAQVDPSVVTAATAGHGDAVSNS